MSRVGKAKILIPETVKVEISGKNISVLGPAGQDQLVLPENLDVVKEENYLRIITRHEEKKSSAMQGLYNRLLAGAILGVEKGYEKKLEIKGIGLKARVEGDKLILSLGFSHPVEVTAPQGIKFTVEKNIIKISGIQKQAVGQITAQIRSLKVPEPYKGKGIRYWGEEVKLKPGKQAKAGEGVQK